MSKNFSYSLVATAPSPATSGTSLVVTAADGTKFYAGQAWVWPAGVQPLVSNAEVITISSIATDTLTIVRAQEGSSARTIVVGDQIAQGITASMYDTLVTSNAGKVSKTGDTMSGALVISGTTPATGLMDVRGNSNISQLHFANSNVDTGGYVTSAGPGNFFLSAGSLFNGSAWLAKNASAAIIGAGPSNDGIIYLFTDTGLTANTTYTPTTRVTVGTDGKLSIVSSGGNKDALGITSTTANTGLTIGGDANLYRPSAAVLKTDGNLIIGTAGTAAGSAATIDGTQTLTGKTATHLLLTAGTTTVSPLFINAGTNKTTPVSGDIEFDGNDLFFTNASGRQTIVSTGKTQTLALKTLTSPVINTGTVGADPSVALGIASKQYVDTRASSSSIIVNEVPGGLVNSSNTAYTTASAFASGSLEVWRNGIKLKGGGVDFTAGSSAFTMVTAPTTGDLLQVNYLVSGTTFTVGTNSNIWNETPAGLVNSSNALFTLSRAYISGSLQVYVDGILQRITTDFTETTPASGTFTFVTAPVTGQSIRVHYQYNLNPSSNADTVDGIHASAYGGVNGQLIADGFGWMDISNLTLTYASVDGHTFTFTVPGDQTAWMRKYAKIRLTQTTVKYFVISLDSTFAGGVTTVTVYGGQNYTLANATITAPSISYQKAPVGFPLSPTIWREEYTNGVDQSTTNVSNTWININSASLAVPIGDWSIEYQVLTYANAAVQVDTTLSNTNNSDSSGSRMVFSKDSVTFGIVHRNRDDYIFTSKTTMYLNTRGSTAANIYNLNSRGMSLIIRAVSTLI